MEVNNDYVIVVDNDFNRANYFDIIGKIYPAAHPPSYAVVQPVIQIVVRPQSAHDFTLNKWFWEEYEPQLLSFGPEIRRELRTCNFEAAKTDLKMLENWVRADIKLKDFPPEYTESGKQDVQRYNKRANEIWIDALSEAAYALLQCDCHCKK